MSERPRTTATLLAMLTGAIIGFAVGAMVMHFAQTDDAPEVSARQSEIGENGGRDE